MPSLEEVQAFLRTAHGAPFALEPDTTSATHFVLTRRVPALGQPDTVKILKQAKAGRPVKRIFDKYLENWRPPAQA